MSTDEQLVCLSMIVKNEAGVIRRCLDSVRPVIDHWVIVDTGSTDGTQAIIRDHMANLPGELHERPWRDFAHNRTEALDLARGKGDYTLIIDADDTLKITRSDKPLLTGDAYSLQIQDVTISYQRPQLIRSALPWRYEGVLHEFLTCDGAAPAEMLEGWTIQRNHDGARRLDPGTYRRDAAVLEAALQQETDPFLRARYRFYLAQSYRDCGALAEALTHYQARAELGFWQEEVFVSLYRAAQLKEQLGHQDEDVIATYLAATDAQPTRVEALYRASLLCRLKKRYEEGYRIARRGLGVAKPANALFVEPFVYDFGLLDEYAINAYWSGHYRDSLDASLAILCNATLSAADQRRVSGNARFASQRLPPGPNLGVPGTESFEAQYDLVAPRKLRSRLKGSPRVVLAIIAGQQEALLPLYLECIEALDYPKSAIVLDIRVADSTDSTERLLNRWLERVGPSYAGVRMAAPQAAESTGRLRDDSLRLAREEECDFYFVVDVDTFLRPRTLCELIALDLPIVAPFLRSTGPADAYSNYHAEIDANGYYHDCDQYSWVLKRLVRGVLEMPVVKCSYLVRADVLGELGYADDTPRHDYVVFAETARQQGIPQYLDNRQIYGYVINNHGQDPASAATLERVKRLMAADDQQPPDQGRRTLDRETVGEADARKRCKAFARPSLLGRWRRQS